MEIYADLFLFTKGDFERRQQTQTIHFLIHRPLLLHSLIYELFKNDHHPLQLHEHVNANSDFVQMKFVQCICYGILKH